jgi:hypothetical protein
LGNIEISIKQIGFNLNKDKFTELAHPRCKSIWSNNQKKELLLPKDKAYWEIQTQLFV